MYVMGDETDRAGQLERLQILLLGYQEAVLLHGIEEPGRDFLAAFADHLRSHLGWSTPLGPMATILDKVETPEAAWDRLWELIDDYEQHLKSSGTPD